MPGEVLEVLEGKAAGRQIPVGDELVIGRGSDETGRLADDPELSRRHARFSTDGEGVLMVEDFNSTNGTFVNGERITGARRLQPGDTVKVGATVMQVLDASGRRLQPTTFSTMPTFEESASQFETVASTPAYQEPHTPPPPPPRQDTPVQQPPGEGPKRSSGRLAAMIGIPVAVVAIAIIAVLALSGGDKDTADPPAPDDAAAQTGSLSVAEIADKAKAQSVEINVSGPVYDPEKGRDVNAKGGGTGIVVDADEGFILTNAHVVSGQTAIKAQLADGTEASGTIEGEAPCEDLAVVRLRPVPDGLSAVTFGDSDSADIGSRVVAAGYPGGFASDPDEREFQATDGTLSQTAASIDGTALEPDGPDALQHQAPIRPGMSGGPTMNDKGEIIGLTMASSANANDQNLNIAISSKRIRQLLPDLEGGKNTGYVGWSELFTEPLGDRRALVVGRIKSGSPADKREIQGGDVIVSLDDTPVSSYPEMCSILNSKSSGDSLKVELIPTSVWGRWLRSPENDLGAFLGRQRTVTKSLNLE